MKNMKGFTLIELMIVIAILGILMAIAIPAYQDYTVRAKVSEGINLAAAAKLGVSEYAQSESTWPADNSEAGVAADIQGNAVTSVVVDSGLITITYNSTTPQINGSILVLSPYTTAGSTRWTCGGGTSDVEPRFLPSTCRG